MNLFRSSFLRQFQSLFVRIPAIQFSRVRMQTVQFKSVTKHESAAVAQSSRNCQASTESAEVREQPGPARVPEPSAVPLSMKRRLETKKLEKLAMPAGPAKPPSLSVESSKHHTSSTGLALPQHVSTKTPHVSISADITLPIS